MCSHDTCMEAIGGTAGILSDKLRPKYEIYNDYNEDMTQFLCVPRDCPDVLAEWLQTVLYLRAQYEEWVRTFTTASDQTIPLNAQIDFSCSNTYSMSANPPYQMGSRFGRSGCPLEHLITPDNASRRYRRFNPRLHQEL